MAPVLHNDIIFVVGRTASGKSTIAKQLLRLADQEYVYIETSDVIKQVTGDWKRSNIAFHPELDVAVVEEIRKLWKHHNVVVGGTRQWSIIKPFEPWATIIWVSAPPLKRSMLFQQRNDASDDVTLYEVDQRDSELGIEGIAAELFSRESRYSFDQMKHKLRSSNNKEN